MPPEPQAELRQAIRDAMRERSITQEVLGRDVGRLEGTKAYPQQSVAEWLSGRVAIGPARIFAIEQAIGLRAGTLSKLEGYVPASAAPVVTVEEALAADPDITADQATMLAAGVAAMRTQTRQRRAKRSR
jgi:transcriptional regulator with XRE-family HTH domain